MRVIATKQGYHGKLREVGEEFDVPDDAKASWFEPKEKPAAEAKTAAKGKQAEGGDKGGQPADAATGEGQAAA